MYSSGVPRSRYRKGPLIFSMLNPPVLHCLGGVSDLNDLASGLFGIGVRAVSGELHRTGTISTSKATRETSNIDAPVDVAMTVA